MKQAISSTYNVCPGGVFSRVLLGVPVAILAVVSTAGALTIGPAGGAVLIEEGAQWRFFRGTRAPSSPAGAWTETGFDDSSWEQGASGFGYGDNDDATVLSDMRGNYVTVYIRKTFTVSSVPPDASVELLIDYDDGFAAYLNGREVARRRLPSGKLTYQSTASSHEAGDPERVVLGRAGDLLSTGLNVLAIEGHNTSATSSDFSLAPSLYLAPDIFQNHGRWITGSPRIALEGRTEAGGVATVWVGSTQADYRSATGTFSVEVDLSPGENTFAVVARNASGTPLEETTITVVYVPPERHFSGTLTEDTVWAGAVICEDFLAVPQGVTLTVNAGTQVFFEEGAGLRVEGRLLADGTSERPILFTHLREGSTWQRILFLEAQQSRFRYCTFQYADSEGAHQDYYLPGPRSYHEAVVALATSLLCEGCTFQNLPDGSADAEGDAIAVISDDPQRPGRASAEIRNCRFVGIGQGIHTRFSYVLVEECFFTGKRGDNDDVDLWGESDPLPLIRNNVFLNPEHDDMINPTKCSAIIVGNIIAGSDDHGVVLRDRGTPIMMNNVIYNCRSAGVAVENTCEALLINNTIFDCGRGVRLFDLGRSGPPYYLTPGGGTATIINSIIWDCPTPISVTDSSNTQAEDRGSHVTVTHSLIEGGQGGVRVSGTYSTVTWGEGNIAQDPRFVDPQAHDFHLQPDSPALEAGTSEQAPDQDIEGNPRPCGTEVDMGAYEYCAAQAGLFRRGDVNADRSVDLSDAVSILLYLFAEAANVSCQDSADTNDSGSVDISDAVFLLEYLFAGGQEPSAPFPGCGLDETEDDLSCELYAACP